MEKLIDIIGWHLTQGLVMLIAGWLYFKLRYKNKKERQEILVEKYEGSYSNVSLLFLIKLTKYFFGFLLACSLLLLAASLIWEVLRNWEVLKNLG